MRKKLLISLVLIWTTIRVSSQTIDSLSLSTSPFFYSLQAALKKPEEVYKLRLQNLKLEEIPPEVFQLKNLVYLDLSKNKLKTIPKEIELLSNLEVLDLTKNKIEFFTLEICNLPHLKVLKLGRNAIVNIPSQVEKLSKLEILDLWDNDIADFPDNLSQLSNLKNVDLRGILFDIKEQKRIEEMLPHAKIHFSPACNCGY